MPFDPSVCRLGEVALWCGISGIAAAALLLFGTLTARNGLVIASLTVLIVSAVCAMVASAVYACLYAGWLVHLVR